MQNAFTWAKTLTLLALIALGILVGRNAEAIAANFYDSGRRTASRAITPDLVPARDRRPLGALGLLVAVCVAQVGSLFAADAWNNVTFTAGEVKNPRRNVPLSLVYGTLLVTRSTSSPTSPTSACCRSSASSTRPTTAWRPRRCRRVRPAGRRDHGGRDHDLDLRLQQRPGARRRAGLLRDGARRPLLPLHRPAQRAWRAGRALLLQGVWASLLVLPRTRLHDTSGRSSATRRRAGYGNLYSNLLDYVVFAVLVFYVLTIVGLFVLRRKRPHADRPYRALGYPSRRSTSWRHPIIAVLLLYRTETTGLRRSGTGSSPSAATRSARATPASRPKS